MIADSNADWIEHGVLRQELVYANDMEQSLQPRRRGVMFCEWYETVRFLPTKDTISLLKKTIQSTNRCVVCGIKRNTKPLSVKTARLFNVKADLCSYDCVLEGQVHVCFRGSSARVLSRVKCTCALESQVHVCFRVFLATGR